MSRGPRHAFTLIEVLLSIAIAAVVMTLAVSLFTTTSRTVGGQEERISGGLRTLEAYTQLERDLLQTVPSLGSSNLMFRMEAPETDDGFSSLRFASLRRLPGEEDIRWTEVVLLEYAVSEDGELIRTARRNAGPPDLPEARQVLLREVTEFSLTALQVGQPFSDWPQEDEEGLPTGIQIRLSVKDRHGKPMEGRVLIPAGLVITSDLERGTQPTGLQPGGGL